MFSQWLPPVAKLKWVERQDQLGKAVFDFDKPEARSGWGHMNFGGIYHTHTNER